MRGQVHTLEAVVGGLLLLTSVVFALQMTAVTPLSASTSSQHIENQQQASAEGILSGAAAAGELERALLYWDSASSSFYDTTTERYYTSKAPPTAFGDRLDRAFDERGIAYNVYVTYYTEAGSRRTDRMVYRGEPSDNAVTAAKSVVITDDAELLDASGDETGTRVDAGNFYMPDTSANSSVYNVARVEVIVWRI